MPYIGAKLSIPLPAPQEAALKEALGKAISLLPGKSENWLMLSFEDNCRLYFRGGNDAPMAFVEVKVFGSAPAAAYEALTARICEIFHDQLQIQPDHIYVKYEETAHWGWNGGNF